MTHSRKKLIEVSIPLDPINDEAARRKQKAPKGFPTSIHKYWAQRPIATCRAVIFAQLVDDPSSWPEKFGTTEAVEVERRRLHRLISRLVLWESSNDEDVLAQARYEIARSLAWAAGKEPPPLDRPDMVLEFLCNSAPLVYDPFSGSGSIPLEAQRLGLRTLGTDLNPVAVLIGKALVEIPSIFSGLPPVNLAHDKHRRWRGAQGLADDVRFYSRWMRDQAEERVGHNYPTIATADGSSATVIAWLWARTVRSPDPAAKGAMVPLVSSFILSNKEGRKAWVDFIADESAQDGWRFSVGTGDLSKQQETVLKRGTKSGRGTNFVCALTGTAISPDYVREEGDAQRLGTRLMAVVAEHDRRRFYVSPTAEQEAIANSVRADDTEGLDIEMPDNPRWFAPPGYGMKRYTDIFTERQLSTLSTFSELVQLTREQVLRDARASGFSDDSQPLSEGGAGATAYADAIATYLAFVVDRMVFYGSALCGWLAKDNAMGKSMPQQALAMSWDFAEGNPFGKSSSDVITCSKAIADCLDEARPVVLGRIENRDAVTADYSERVVISTDPPYYDNIGYADLSEFFYVWLRKSLGKTWPNLFRRLTTPKADELVAIPYRHGSSDEAEAFFMKGMSRALLAMRHGALDEMPLSIYYAFKQSESGDEGVTSAGWSSFLQAVVDAGLVVDGTWPVRTESAGRLIGQGTNALASSIVLVCRKRATDAAIITRSDFLRQLRRELPEAIDAIRAAGVGPVDMQQSVIGPGMGVFSRHARVLEDDDSPMPVKTALALINRVWEEIEQDLDAAFDAATQVALAWYATYGFDPRPSGEAIVLAQAKNTALNTLFDSGVFQNLHGRVALTEREKLPDDWTPEGDKSLTVWECVQHTARVLMAEDGGSEAAAKLVAGMGPSGDQARALAYRLFEIATNKGWSQEALVYNELAQEWPRLQDAAGVFAAAVPRQGTLDL